MSGKVRKFVRVRKDLAHLRQALVDRTGEPNLECFCAIAATFSLKIIPEGVLVFGQFQGDPSGHPRKKVCEAGWDHCWVEYQGHIFDIKATQFGAYPDVFVVPASSPLYLATHKGAEAKAVTRMFPPEQRPGRFRIHLT